MKCNDCSKDITQEVNDELDLENRKWFHRRKLAYRSLNFVLGILIVIVGVIFFGTPDMITAFATVENILIAIVIGLISIVGFYYGASTWFSIKK